MKLDKALKRDAEIQRRKYGPREDGRSVFDIEKIQKKRAEEIKRKRFQKQEMQEAEIQ